jgi:hypothetical protein
MAQLHRGPGKCDNEGDGQDYAATAEHEAGRGEPCVTFPARDRTGEVTKRCSYGAAGGAGDNRPRAGNKACTDEANVDTAEDAT